MTKAQKWVLCAEGHKSCEGFAEQDISHSGIRTETYIREWERIAAEMYDRLVAERNQEPMTREEQNFCASLCDGEIMHLFDEVISLRQKIGWLESRLNFRGLV